MSNKRVVETVQKYFFHQPVRVKTEDRVVILPCGDEVLAMKQKLTEGWQALHRDTPRVILQIRVRPGFGSDGEEGYYLSAENVYRG